MAGKVLADDVVLMRANRCQTWGMSPQTFDIGLDAGSQRLLVVLTPSSRKVSASPT